MAELSTQFGPYIAEGGGGGGGGGEGGSKKKYLCNTERTEASEISCSMHLATEAALDVKRVEQ